MNVLVVEDEPALAGIIKKGLTEHGYTITVAPDGELGLQLSTDNEFDVIILDIMLPGINGVQLCKTLREKNNTTPILFLTALGTTENIVAGLNAGADDYLLKPFKFAELEARIRSLKRRSTMNAKEEDSLSIGPLKVRLEAKLVTLHDELVSLTPTEFRLLKYFVQNKNKVLSRLEILEHVWGIDFNMGTNVVDVYVNYLRKKIDTDANHKLLQTVVGMGYMLKTN